VSFYPLFFRRSPGDRPPGAWRALFVRCARSRSPARGHPRWRLVYEGKGDEQSAGSPAVLFFPSTERSWDPRRRPAAACRCRLCRCSARRLRIFCRKKLPAPGRESRAVLSGGCTCGAPCTCWPTLHVLGSGH